MKQKNYKGVSQVVITIILVIVGAIAGVLFYVYNSGKEDRSITDVDSYKTESIKGGFTIEIPDVMEESDETYKTSSGEEQLAYFECDIAAVSVARQNMGGELTVPMIEKLFENYTVNGENVNAQNKGDYILISYKASGKGILENDEDAYLVIGYMPKDTYLYAVSTVCYYSDAADYEEYMIKWIESFSL
ncbi:MAG: hypothetical protein IJC65_07785 [Oscillospiraceae bacterium]|nr:hypothetical protein [Oscillospiraceae bacterium]